MAVIKCANCENEIMDTEIVCPYCGNPVVGQLAASAPEPAENDAMSGATVKIPAGKGHISDNDAQAGKDAGEWTEVPNVTDETSKIDMKSDRTNNVRSDVNQKQNASAGKRGPSEKEQMDATRKYARSSDAGVAARSSHSRKNSRTKKKKKESKWVVLGITLVGIVVIIFLVINVFSRIFGEGLFEPEKESKKAKDYVESSAEEKDLGFEFNSHTLTITDESIVSENYEANSEKPWKDHVADITNLTIANGIEIIGTHAFDDIYGLKHVTLATTVSNIGSSAFYGCTELEEVVVDSEKSKLKSIGDNAFTDCPSLKRVTFGKQLKRIGAGSFKSCDSLTRVEIPDTTTEIGEEAFLGCPDLVIVCSEGSYAHTYALENGIAVETTQSDNEDDEEINATTSMGGNSSFGTGTATPSQNSNKEKKNKEDKKKEDNKKEDSEKKDENKEDNDKNSTDVENADKEDKSQPTTPTNGDSGTSTVPADAPPAKDVNTTTVYPSNNGAPTTGGSPATNTPPATGGNSNGNGNTINQQIAGLQDALAKATTPEEKANIAAAIQRLMP